MTLFEYISIATSLILSFSLARILTNLAPIFASGHRYWVHSAWVVVLLFAHASMFWGLWLYQDVEAWTLVKFLLLLVWPFMLLIGASLLVPVGLVPDYRVYFESIRTPFYSVLLVANLQEIPVQYLLMDIPIFHELRWSSLVLAFVLIAGLVGRKRSIDIALVLLWIVSAIGGLVMYNDHEATRTMMESMRG